MGKNTFNQTTEDTKIFVVVLCLGANEVLGGQITLFALTCE